MERLVLLFTLLASTAAYAAPTVEADGLCPSITLTVTDATPRHGVVLYSGAPGGTSTLHSGPCAGTTLEVADANQRGHELFSARAGGDGSVTFAPADLGPGGCGNAVQGLDVATCEVSEAVPLALDCSTLDKGLVSYWPGNGREQDVVGGHGGTVEGTVDYAPGVFGDAFTFDGTSAVVVRPTDDLEYEDGEPFTYAMWVYNERSDSAPYHIFGKRHGCGGHSDSFDYQWVVEGGHQSWGSYTCDVAVTPVPPTDEWQHIVASYDGSVFRAYLDGALTGSDCSGGGSIPTRGGELRIGSSGSCGTINGQGVVGLVDEVKLWDRALTDDEIACASGPGPH